MNTLKLKIPEPLEKEIQKAILSYLHMKGVFCWKQSNVGIFKPDGAGYIPPALKGVSDILGVYKGKFLAIEVKRKSGVVSAEQVAFINNINNHGGIAFIAHSIDDVIERGI